MTKFDLTWFQERKGKEIIRMYKGNETKVTILKEKGEDYAKYFHDLQNEGFTFRDTGENIAASSYNFDLPEVESKPVTKPRISISDNLCLACEA